MSQIDQKLRKQMTSEGAWRRTSSIPARYQIQLNDLHSFAAAHATRSVSWDGDIRFRCNGDWCIVTYSNGRKQQNVLNSLLGEFHWFSWYVSGDITQTLTVRRCDDVIAGKMLSGKKHLLDLDLDLDLDAAGDIPHFQRLKKREKLNERRDAASALSSNAFDRTLELKRAREPWHVLSARANSLETHGGYS